MGGWAKIRNGRRAPSAGRGARLARSLLELLDVREVWTGQRELLTRFFPPRVANVLGGRLGIRTGAPETLASLADELGISRERVRQMELRAVDRLRRAAVAMEIELREPEILVRLRVREARPARKRPWRVRRELLRDLGLDERETEILARRLALRGAERETLRAVAHASGLSAERVRQIERDALRALVRREDAIAHCDPELLAILRRRTQADGRHWGRGPRPAVGGRGDGARIGPGRG